jgi:hypothetical protein
MLVTTYNRVCTLRMHGLSGQREVPRGKPVASERYVWSLLAASVKFHGASPWPLRGMFGRF